ncbi:PREDICTED: chromatin modification-related protein EAF1 B-like isoform X1 [Prunus mume]|uniref:Chromatin modification-related protein EAF1 B-like isoform X1 n=1 Tax=Prunus mume TaxID=102107 RepID=A0ABM1LTS7_PRUMU|nr:PREDICTED: chromatin modification-related protein EAF1 B-like isoform X1 [Prunus mume]
MHGCSSGSALLVNAEVDSMGGVVDGGIGIGLKTSPRRAAIEKAQAELRQEYDVREERRRELEFLEKGGNPLDFKLGNGASVSVQSTSLTDQHPEQFVTSEAKGSFALTASPRGDSVESSGRPEVPTLCEPNSADNLLLFDGDNDVPDGERNSMHLSRRNNIGPSEQSSQMDGTQNAKESEDSAIFRPYARRNRSRPNRDGTRSNSMDIQGRGGQGSSLPARGVSKDPKRLISETNNQKDQPPVASLKSVSSNGDIAPKIVTCDNQFDMELEGVQALEIVTGPTKDSSESKLDVTTPKSLRESEHSQPCQVDSQEVPIDVCGRPDVVEEREPLVSSVLEGPSCAATTKTENEISSAQVNGFSNSNRESKIVPNEVHVSSAALGTKGLDSESSCTQTSVGLDVNNDSDICTTTRNTDNGNIIESSDVDGAQNLAGGEMVQEGNETKAVDSGCIVNDHQASVCQNHSGNGEVKDEEDMSESRPELHNEAKLHSNIEGEQPSDHTISGTDKKVDDVLDNSSKINKENSCTSISQGPQDLSMCEVPETVLSGRDTAAGSDCQTPGVHLKVIDKAHEDSILEEARIIEAKRKRIAELAVHSLPSENRRKSQWDFVLEEMAWLANDFAQERLWKLTAASQICHRVASTSGLRMEKQHQHWVLKKVAHDLARAVKQFWHSAETLLNGDDSSSCKKNCNSDLVGSMSIDSNEASKAKDGESNMEPNKYLEPQYSRKDLALSMQGYAVRFLKYNNSRVPVLQAHAPATPERMSDLGITEMSWEDHLTEENLFYAVPSGAMETYRKSIESHLVQFERSGSSMQEEVDTSMYDAGAEFSFQEAAYDEDEGETSTYYLPGAFEGSKSSKSNQKKRQKLKIYASRSYEAGADLAFAQCTSATQQPVSMGKRPASLNVGSIPTKRMRTASRQRVVGPFGGGATGSNVQAQMKTDASSGDTNSFQDDQSTLHGGSQFQKSVEVESAGDFEKQLPYDYAETSMKPKKKKKAKHLGSTYDQGWQLDSAILNEQQRDHSKKRLESHHFESNGTIGLYGQHIAKKPKILKQSLDNTYDSMTPMAGSVPSPVASQMSNMSNTSKFIKLIGGRDRGRKTKSLKMSVGQAGSAGPWSLFEDQALVVLVHDMGPNWEFISDAINSTLQLKFIFRQPKECKERHKILMDMNAGDGADSAEDSGSSQPYPSTIPGIPKGSARQLFERLKTPMEEETLKSHFEKIIKIGQKHHYRRSQNDNQDPKQITTVHNSHVIALSQVCPNNLNGGLLTPLDLCDAPSSSSDVLGYQGSHASGLAMSNQSAIGSLLPSGANASLQGSSGVVLGSNLSSPSGPPSANVREGRYSGPRASSLPVDEQQRVQHYNQMLSGRNIQQSSLSVPGALAGTDRGVRMVPGANGMGMMCGMNRGMPMSRPGFQGMASSSMLNSGSMLSSSMVGIPSPVNMHSGAGSGQGNLMLRPRDALHMMRPGHNPEHQRQLMVPELQMQVTQGNGQGIAPFNGLSSGFPNQTTPPSVQTYPGHAQQQHQVSQQQSHALSSPHHSHLQGPNHGAGQQQQAYAIRIAKERQLQQQRYLQQQQQQQQQHQQQFAASNSLAPHVQTQPQLPISSTLQNNSQIQSQTSPHPVSLPPMTPSSPMTPISSQHQQKLHLPLHGLSRNPGAVGMTNQMGKQRQRQPQQHHLQQSGRHHPQQRQLAQSQQQAKLSKGMGRGNSMLHQNLSIDPANLSIDPSHLNGLPMPPGSQALEKGEQIMQLMQGQGAYSGSGLNPVTSKPLVPQSPNHSQLPQKLLSSPPPSSKQLQQMPSHSDNSTQGQVPPVPSGNTISASHQAVSPSIKGSNQQQLQSQQQAQQQKQANQTQPYVQRVLQQNRQVNLEIPNKSQNDLAQVDEQPGNGTSQVGVSMAIPQSSIDSSNVVPVPSAITSQWKSSEPVYDSNMSNSTTQVGPIGSPQLTNSSGNEPVPPISQGLGPRQLSGSLPSHGHNVGAQWQQQQQQLLQQSPSLPSPSQQHHQQQEQQQQEQQSPQHQLPLQQQSQQQMQHLQAGQGSLYMMTGNSKPE